MPKEYEKIACTVGLIVKEAFREIKREPVPDQFDDLLEKLEERECQSITEPGEERTPHWGAVKGSRR